MDRHETDNFQRFQLSLRNSPLALQHCRQRSTKQAKGKNDTCQLPLCRYNLTNVRFSFLPSEKRLTGVGRDGKKVRLRLADGPDEEHHAVAARAERAAFEASNSRQTAVAWQRSSGIFEGP